jgi:cell fate regulator YaaT (PSP1 superfamily)
MPLIVGVRFRPVTKIYYFDPNSVEDIQVNTRVIVETARGLEMGMVAQPVHDVPDSELKGKLKRVVRRATPVDLLQVEQYKAQEPAALTKCDKLVKEMEVPIRVIGADYSFDGTRLVFSFVSEQRIDFRDLVKALSGALSTRIEMKQVGARDETKLLDGYGRCGRRLCCSSWLTEFHPVSIKMAKQQNLPLAPAEISGLCGRLLCCLAYENEQYSEMKEQLPKVGSRVATKEGATGVVQGVNVIKETILVKLDSEEEDDDDGGEFVELPAQETEVLEESTGQIRVRKPKRKKKK